MFGLFLSSAIAGTVKESAVPKAAVLLTDFKNSRLLIDFILILHHLLNTFYELSFSYLGDKLFVSISN
jgi:hypothetical protein